MHNSHFFNSKQTNSTTQLHNPEALTSDFAEKDDL